MASADGGPAGDGHAPAIPTPATSLENERPGWLRLAADSAVVGACRPAALVPFPRLLAALGQRFVPGRDLARVAGLADERLVFGWNPRRADSLRIVMRLARPLAPAAAPAALGLPPGAEVAAVPGGRMWRLADDQAVALLEDGALLVAGRPAEVRRAAAEGPAAERPRFPAALAALAGTLRRPEPFWGAAVLEGDAWVRHALATVAVEPAVAGGGEGAFFRLRAEIEAVDAEQAAAMEQLAGLLPLLSGVAPDRVSVAGDGVRRTLDLRLGEAEARRLLGASAAADGPPPLPSDW